jgi:hypothetical protein
VTTSPAQPLNPSIADALDRLGWSGDDPLVRDALPGAARGTNLVLVLPPSPAAASPALAGVLDRLGTGHPGLLLAPAAQLDEWGRIAHELGAGAGLRIQVAHGTSRATRRLRDDGVDLLVATPETAVALQRRSALHADGLIAVVLAWPEAWEDEAAVAPLMQDCKEAQRVVLTSAPDLAAGLVERYARRALTLGASSLDGVPVGPVRTVSVPWSRRVAALADLVELLDPATLTVWTADRGLHA